MSLQTIVQNAPLDPKTKQSLLDQIANDGDTPETRAVVKDALQDYIDAGFKKLGVELDANDPKVQTVTNQLNAAMNDAENELNEELENLNIDAAVAQAKANKALDGIQVGAMKANLAA
jgi:hypothetical protein